MLQLAQMETLLEIKINRAGKDDVKTKLKVPPLNTLLLPINPRHWISSGFLSVFQYIEGFKEGGEGGQIIPFPKNKQTRLGKS